ncbi:hypothetical protein NDU88_004699 [Pleurodeles waltl]|uniref:Uncharacterized protein n=1 Tax=Pleurodeles waltl TaxID=8319 RepID=A0AAV7TSQ6_PLEWA|nr:hypothetical protein NDU88_004699 [Pleurodeles waltl]
MCCRPCSFVKRQGASICRWRGLLAGPVWLGKWRTGWRPPLQHVHHPREERTAGAAGEQDGAGVGRGGCSSVTARQQPVRQEALGAVGWPGAAPAPIGLGTRVRRPRPRATSLARERGQGTGRPQVQGGAASAGHLKKAGRQYGPRQTGEAGPRTPSIRRDGGQGSMESVMGRGKGSSQVKDRGSLGEPEFLGEEDREGWGAQRGVGQGKDWEAENSGDSSGAGSIRGRELSHILEWSDEADQEVEMDGITLKVRPPSCTYEGLRKAGGGELDKGAGSSDSEGVAGGKEASCGMGGF